MGAAERGATDAVGDGAGAERMPDAERAPDTEGAAVGGAPAATRRARSFSRARLTNCSTMSPRISSTGGPYKPGDFGPAAGPAFGSIGVTPEPIAERISVSDLMLLSR